MGGEMKRLKGIHESEDPVIVEKPDSTMNLTMELLIGMKNKA